MNNWEKARRASDSIGKQYRDEPWWAGVAIDYDADEGFYLTIRVTEKNHLDFPNELDGIPIKVELRKRAIVDVDATAFGAVPIRVTRVIIGNEGQ